MAEKKKEEAVKEAKKDTKDTKEEKKLKETEAAKKTAEEKPEGEPAVQERQLSESTENKRKKKAERREAKAARKAANIVEEKKKRPNNLLLTILIFGVIIGMFAFVGGYNYFKKPVSIEKYMKDNGMADMYKNAPISEYSTLTLKAEGNDLKIVIKIDEDAPKEELDEYTGKEGDENLKDMAAYFLTTMKPEVRGFTASAKIAVKQGDEKLNSVKMSYREAKKFAKEQQKKAEEEKEEGTDSDADADADTGVAEEAESEAATE